MTDSSIKTFAVRAAVYAAVLTPIIIGRMVFYPDPAPRPSIAHELLFIVGMSLVGGMSCAVLFPFNWPLSGRPKKVRERGEV